MFHSTIQNKSVSIKIPEINKKITFIYDNISIVLQRLQNNAENIRLRLCFKNSLDLATIDDIVNNYVV